MIDKSKITQKLDDQEKSLINDLLNNIKLFSAFKRKDKRIIASKYCYGTKLPSSGEEGQIFFLIDEVKEVE